MKTSGCLGSHVGLGFNAAVMWILRQSAGPGPKASWGRSIRRRGRVSLRQLRPPDRSRRFRPAQGRSRSS
jgi:hypothetical protein